MPAATAKPSVPPRAPLTLSRRRKAAIIVQLLVSDGNRVPLTQLPEHLQEDLTKELAAIRLVDRDTVNAVAEEFVSLLDAIGLCAPGGPSQALDALADLISPSLLARLRERFGNTPVDPWPALLNLEDATVIDILLNEDMQIGAVLLSKLPVSRAAKLLARLPGDRARRIAIAVKATQEIAPQAVLRIGQALLAGHGSVRATAFDRSPGARMGDILNSASPATRNAVLSDLDGADQEFASDVRKAIFTFEDIPARLEPADLPVCLRDADPDDVARAVAFSKAAGGAPAAAAEFILASLPQRMAGQIRDAAEDIGEVSQDEGEAAMTAVATAIRTLVDAGEIKLIVRDDAA